MKSGRFDTALNVLPKVHRPGTRQSIAKIGPFSTLHLARVAYMMSATSYWSSFGITTAPVKRLSTARNAVLSVASYARTAVMVIEQFTRISSSTRFSSQCWFCLLASTSEKIIWYSRVQS